jgi:glycosyltransferase involved in cell wall biosynthesis
MRIALVYDCIYPESLGGVEHRNYQLARALAARGHRITLAGWAREGGTRIPGVEVLPLPGRGPAHDASGRRRLGHALRLARAVVRLPVRSFDIVETANIPHAHLLPLAVRCAAARRPFVVTWYEVWGPYWRHYVGATWPLFAVAERLAAQIGKTAVAVSPLTERRLEAIRLRNRPLPSTIGVPVAAIREAAAHASPGPPLVYAGRLIAEKRLDLLLRAVAQLPRGGGPVLAIVGGGPERDALARLAAELGVTDAVVFRGLLPEPEDVWREVGAARVAVQPSRREGFGLFPLEAMAAGRPVVYCTSSESAVPALVRHGIEGVEVEPEPAALAATLARLLAGGEEYERLAEAAARRGAEHDWGEVAKHEEERFAAALARGPLTSPRGSPPRY